MATPPATAKALSFLTPQDFLGTFPTEHNLIYNFPPGQIAADAKSTAVILPPRFPILAKAFLHHKRAHGSALEQALYASLDWKQLVTRLIVKRPLVFMGAGDFSILRDGSRVTRPTEQWDRVGSAAEGKNKQLTLAQFLSYDEMMLSSLVAVSSATYFVNEGDRSNEGKRGLPGSFEERGVIVGLVGARFERADRMDAVFVQRRVAKPRQHAELTDTFTSWFGVARHPDVAFDCSMYKARMYVTIEVLLFEADRRAAEVGRRAHVYVVGLGLGVWAVDQRQESLYIEAFTETLVMRDLPNIDIVEFGWIDATVTARKECQAAAAKRGIRAVFTRNSPAHTEATTPPPGKARPPAGYLRVVSYAWDSNAFPGNEYWAGSLSASGDPAAACSSTIPQLHNPYINPFAENLVVLRDQTRPDAELEREGIDIKEMRSRSATPTGLIS